jgi:hypothetical protein
MTPSFAFMGDPHDEKDERLTLENLIIIQQAAEICHWQAQELAGESA